jgi:hypothetical protein
MLANRNSNIDQLMPDFSRPFIVTAASVTIFAPAALHQSAALWMAGAESTDRACG